MNFINKTKKKRILINKSTKINKLNNNEIKTKSKKKELIIDIDSDNESTKIHKLNNLNINNNNYEIKIDFNNKSTKSNKKELILNLNSNNDEETTILSNNINELKLIDTYLINNNENTIFNINNNKIIDKSDDIINNDIINDNNDDNDDNDNDYDYDIDLYDENGNLIPPINYEEYDKMTENYYKNNAKFYSKYRIDIKCSINECNNKATYNFFNNHKPKFCNFHKSKNMIKFGEYNKCKFENCLKYSSYNLSGYKYSLYCNTHKRDDMINVKSKRCLTQFCETIVNNDKYLNYCLYCFINIYPDIKINVRYKIKEHVVIDFIKQNFPNFTWLHNKQVQDGCSKKRPDLQVHLGFQVIIVEIDEDLIILIYI